MDKETSEIAKLTERISKDPKSRLFVPLAEEYKKAGDIEMAIHVLTEGLKNNPGYTTARFFLGRLLLERGDTAAARKELEEVVEAIPDNLPAHKKLAELFALQGNEADALRHYKIALALNPGDKDVAARISELEAAFDAKQNLDLRKTPVQPAPVEDQASPGEAASFAETFGELTGPAESVGPDQASASFLAEQEEPEEVLIVEPLEEELPSMEAVFSDIDFLSQQDQAGEPAFAREETAEDETGTRPDEDGQREEPEGDAGEAAFPSGVFEESAEAPFGEIAAALPEPAEASGQAGEFSDDFTTDTLAELYIAQGFYEKAIDIYERMLAERPDSRGLKDKLERVRAMAVSPEAPFTAEPAEHSQAERDEGFSGFDLGPPDREGTAGERPAYPDFEPREYVPPTAELSQAEEYQSPAESRTSGEDPGKAIARLEKWLVNIAKER